ncbi:MAG TPA: ParB/RepB/Spo0J family partition protein [Thermoanaerobaculia bacterium]|nr:ParB/RepB/Spo0J family partition protein [Thermoanaerobaculia bacterium]
MTPAKKRGLGRGLDALIQRPDVPEPAESGERGISKLPVEALKPNRWQPRTSFDEGELEALAASIRIQGMVQPLIVTADGDGSYSIVAGERRWRAARRAGLEEVPVVVRGDLDDRSRLELALVENLQRSDLNALEEAEAYATLQEKFGLPQEEIALRVGKGRTTITNALRLLKLPPEVRELLRAGRLTAGQARPLLALGGSDQQIALAERAVRDQLSARQLEQLAAPRERAKRPPRKVEVHTAAAEEKLTRRLQTKVEIRRRGRGGQLQIRFHSEEELMRLYDLLMGKGDDA